MFQPWGGMEPSPTAVRARLSVSHGTFAVGKGEERTSFRKEDHEWNKKCNRKDDQEPKNSSPSEILSLINVRLDKGLDLRP
jgi:hypothetical protein